MKSKTILLHLVFATSFFPVCFSQLGDAHKIDIARIGHNTSLGRYVKIRGFNMYYETYGNGEPLLLIHGNGGSINNFTNQVPYFAEKYKVILADSRDQGKSADPGDSLSYDMMTDDFNALLDSLHLDSCLVIGWSDGGIIGLLLAMHHPKKVKKLAITGANLWPDTTSIDPLIYHLIAHYIDSLERSPETAGIKHQLKLNRLLLREPNITLQELHFVKCPTLVIAGDRDVIRPEHTLLIAQSIPRSYLWILPDSGHFTLITYKDEFNKVVNDFLLKPYKKIEGEARFN